MELKHANIQVSSSGWERGFFNESLVSLSFFNESLVSLSFFNESLVSLSFFNESLVSLSFERDCLKETTEITVETLDSV